MDDLGNRTFHLDIGPISSDIYQVSGVSNHGSPAESGSLSKELHHGWKTHAIAHNLSQLDLESVSTESLGVKEEIPVHFEVLESYSRAGHRLLGPFATGREDEDTFINAVTQGWDAVETTLSTCPSWRHLKDLDQEVFKHKDNATQLAAVIQLAVSKYYSIPQELHHQHDIHLPLWFLPRPSQEALDHNALVDFVPWPGMRERLTFGQTRYHTDDFWTKLVTYSRFRWSQGVIEAYELNQETGLLGLTTEFRTSLYDINCWTIESDFFQWYPEFAPDVPRYEPIVGIQPTVLPSEADLTRIRALTRRRQQGVTKPATRVKVLHNQRFGKYIKSLQRLENLNVELHSHRSPGTLLSLEDPSSPP